MEASSTFILTDESTRRPAPIKKTTAVAEYYSSYQFYQHMKYKQMKQKFDRHLLELILKDDNSNDECACPLLPSMMSDE